MKNILIVGGQLHNKGAQAMTYTAIEEARDKYPNHEMVLLASVYDQRDEDEKKDLNFKVLPWPIRAQIDILKTKSLKYIGSVEYIKYLIKGSGITSSQQKEIKTILNNTDLIIDVSGYALSSQRGYIASLKYLFNIIIAEERNIPMILYPQSIGPFNYNEKEKRKIGPLLTKYLKYPMAIYVRENDGIEALKPFNLSNVYKSFDSVLQNSNNFDESSIYKKQELGKLSVNVHPSSVAIIPNIKIMVHGDEKAQYHLYKEIINKLLLQNRKVYLIRHSYEDLEICKEIKKDFKEQSNVILVQQDLNCIQIDQLISHFDFIIASRYHSIIHAYKNGVPALVFGWAIKYQELLTYFEQDKFLFDVRNKISDKEVKEGLDNLLINFDKESKKIQSKMINLPRRELLKKI